MDSSDFAVAGKKTTSTKHPSWSYKVNGPGQRFMFIIDAATRVRYIKGGYTPKLYDGDFLKMNMRELEENFNGAKIGADQAFQYGANHFRNIRFFVPIQPADKKKSKRGNDNDNTLCRKHAVYNERLYAARARVEMPFGSIKTKFESLSTPWKEELEQQDHLVKFAAGLHNFEL